MCLWPGHIAVLYTQLWCHWQRTLGSVNAPLCPPDIYTSLVPRPSTPNAVEGLVNSYVEWRQVDVWSHGTSGKLHACTHGAISHGSRRPPDVILRRSFTRPSTTLAVIKRPGNKTMTFSIMSSTPLLHRIWSSVGTCTPSTWRHTRGENFLTR